MGVEVPIILAIIAALTFFSWRWVFGKFIKNVSSRNFAISVATVIGTPIIYVGLIAVFITWMYWTPTKDFDRADWFKNKEERFQMSDDIIESKMLVGKSASEVKQLLGEPNWIIARNRWSYEAGSGGGGLGFLFHHLDIILDANNRVTSVEHTTIRD